MNSLGPNSSLSPPAHPCQIPRVITGFFGGSALWTESGKQYCALIFRYRPPGKRVRGEGGREGVAQRGRFSRLVTKDHCLSHTHKTLLEFPIDRHHHNHHHHHNHFGVRRQKIPFCSSFSFFFQMGWLIISPLLPVLETPAYLFLLFGGDRGGGLGWKSHHHDGWLGPIAFVDTSYRYDVPP